MIYRQQPVHIPCGFSRQHFQGVLSGWKVVNIVNRELRSIFGNAEMLRLLVKLPSALQLPPRPSKVASFISFIEIPNNSSILLLWKLPKSEVSFLFTMLAMSEQMLSYSRQQKQPSIHFQSGPIFKSKLHGPTLDVENVSTNSSS